MNPVKDLKEIFYTYINMTKTKSELQEALTIAMSAIAIHIDKLSQLEELVDQHSKALLLLGSGYSKAKHDIKMLWRAREEDAEEKEAEEDSISLGSEDSEDSEMSDEEPTTSDEEFIASEDEDMSEAEEVRECCKRKRAE